MRADLPTVAVVIVTYNSRHEIDACLTSVLETSPPPDVVVVDNASPDGTAAHVRERFPGVRVIEPRENVGFARGNNAGAAATTSEFLVLLNPDTVVPPSAIESLIGVIRGRPAAAIVAPRLVDGDGRPELSFGPTLSPLGELRQKVRLTLYNRRVPMMERSVERWTHTAGPRAWVSGACLLIRRADWDAVGGLDERFFMYTEDVDLCVRVRARGREVWFAPEVEVRHLRGRSASRNPATERLRRQSQLAYYEKHQPGWAWLLRLYLKLTGRGAHV